MAKDHHILHGLEDYSGFMGLEYVGAEEFVKAYRFYQEFDRQVEGALFILNLRDQERWISSRLDHNDGSYAKVLLLIHSFETLTQLADKWRSDWDKHVANVQATLPSSKLLIFHIERQLMSVIDEFLGLEPSMDLSRIPANFTRSQLSRWLSRYTPKAPKKPLPKRNSSCISLRSEETPLRYLLNRPGSKEAVLSQNQYNRGPRPPHMIIKLRRMVRREASA